MDGEVAAVAAQVEWVAAAVEAEFDARVMGAEVRQARDQPARREGGQHGDGQKCRLPPCGDGARDGAGEVGEVMGQFPRQRLPGGRQPHRAPFAPEEPQAQRGLQIAHLTADSALRDAQLFRRAGVAFVAGSGLEGAQRGEGGKGKVLGHGGGSMRFAHLYRSFPCLLVGYLTG